MDSMYVYQCYEAVGVLIVCWWWHLPQLCHQIEQIVKLLFTHLDKMNMVSVNRQVKELTVSE